MFTAKHTKEKFDTRNAWGFAGGIGDKYAFADDLYAKVGKAYYRHLPPSSFITVYHNDARVFDRVKSKKNIDAANVLINDILSGASG